ATASTPLPILPTASSSQPPTERVATPARRALSFPAARLGRSAAVAAKCRKPSRRQKNMIMTRRTLARSSAALLIFECEDDLQGMSHCWQGRPSFVWSGLEQAGECHEHSCYAVAISVPAAPISENSLFGLLRETIIRKIDSGGVHRTLGKNYWLKGAVDAAGREHALQAFGRAGSKRFAIIVSHGLAPHHSCVDYGCGIVRVGVQAIRLLYSGNCLGRVLT